MKNKQGEQICQQCKNADFLAHIHAKHSDLLNIEYYDTEHDGYNNVTQVYRGSGKRTKNCGIPNTTGAGGDYLKFTLCLNCGQVQGAWGKIDIAPNK